MSPEIQAEWDALQTLAVKQRESTDSIVSKVLEEALVTKAQSLAIVAKAKPPWLDDYPVLAAMFSALPAEEPDLNETKAPEADEALAAADDPEAAERLIREAHLLTMRGDKARAKELLDQAERAAPRSATVLVALADAAVERHNVKEAVRLLEAAKNAEPGNVAIEKRHAEAVFQQARGLVFDPTSALAAETAAGAKSAMLLSVMFPGVGQMVSGEVSKGIFFLLMVAAGWIGALLIGFKGLFAILGMGSSQNANGLVLLPLAVAILFHLIAIFDAAAKAKTVVRRKVDRPVPPANLPFE